MKRARMIQRELFMDHLSRQLGEAYIWGANGGTAQDCSGLVTEAMRTFRYLIDDGHQDMTAHGWLNYFANQGCAVEAPKRGCLIGWDKPHAGHIAVCTDHHFCIEAGGGGSWTDYSKKPSKYTREQWREYCIGQGAQVCVRSIERDREVHLIVDPWKLLEAPLLAQARAEAEGVKLI